MKSNEQYINEIFQKYNKIKNTKEEKNYKKNIIISPINTFFRIVTIMLSWVALTGCVAYCANFVIDKVFIKPKVMTYQDSIKVNDEEKKSLISKEKAEECASLEMKNKFNKTPGNIKQIELRKDSISYEPRWIIFYDNNMSVQLNAITGKIKSLTDFTIDDTKIISKLSKEEAKKIAIELYNSIGYNENDYELANFDKNGISENANLYTADFSKKYGDIFNDYQTVRITFIPEEKQIVTFNLFDFEFDNNELIITKEQAIEIAKNKNKKLDDNKFKIISEEAKLKIVKMNDYVYGQENPINNIEDENDYETYVVEPRTRFAWVVELNYNSEFAKKVSYFVDATTGEIIGGDEVM